MQFKQDSFGDSLDSTYFSLGIGTRSLSIDTSSKPTNLNPKVDLNYVSYIKDANNVKVGILFGKQGLIVFDATKITATSFTDSRSANAQFLNKMNSATSKALYVRGLTNYTSNYYVCRVKNKQFNYSNNPTFVDYSTNMLKQAYMLSNTPVVYITAIGLYNQNNQLVAIAKPNKPLKKDFFTQVTIQVKLDY